MTTRKSLVTHFMPLGVMPTFYDSSEVSALPYRNGGYCLDRLVATHGEPAATAGNGAGESASQAPIRLRRLKRYVPQPVRKVLREQVDWLTSNPTLGSLRHSVGAKSHNHTDSPV